MLEQENVCQFFGVTLTKFLISILMRLEPASWLQVWTWQWEFIMQLLLSALLFFKGMRDKYQRLFLIPKELRSFLLVLIILHVCGMCKQENIFKHSKAMKMKFSLVNLITKEILLLLDQRIIRVEFGEIVLIISLNSKNDEIIYNYLTYLSILNRHLIQIEKSNKDKFIIFYHNYTLLSDNNSVNLTFKALSLVKLLQFYSFFGVLYHNNLTKAHHYESNSPYCNL